jgi:hypothetical protein
MLDKAVLLEAELRATSFWRKYFSSKSAPYET